MSKKKAVKGAKSWRSIAQGSRKALTPEMRRRKLIQISRSVGLGILICGGLVVIAYSLVTAKNYLQRQALAGMARNVQEVEFESNGAMTLENLANLVHLPYGQGLMEVNLLALKKEIEQIGQVERATVERQFPDHLRVKIKENKPLVKLIAKELDGTTKGYLVSSKGEVFQGYGYKRERINELPYIEGVSLEVIRGKITPLENIKPVAELVQTTKKYKSYFYDEFKMISLEYLTGEIFAMGSFIKVKTRHIGELIFAPRDFHVQLDRLESILQYMSDEQLHNILRIDLSNGDQAAVQLKKETPTLL